MSHKLHRPICSQMNPAGARIRIWSLAASRQSSWPSMARSVWSRGTDPRRASPSKRNTTSFYAEGRLFGCAWKILDTMGYLWIPIKRWCWSENDPYPWKIGVYPTFRQAHLVMPATQCFTPSQIDSARVQEVLKAWEESKKNFRDSSCWRLSMWKCCWSPLDKHWLGTCPKRGALAPRHSDVSRKLERRETGLEPNVWDLEVSEVGVPNEEAYLYGGERKDADCGCSLMDLPGSWQPLALAVKDSWQLANPHEPLSIINHH